MVAWMVNRARRVRKISALPEVMTLMQASRLLHVSMKMLSRAYVKGEFPNAYKVRPRSRTSKISIPRDDVRSYFEKWRDEIERRFNQS